LQTVKVFVINRLQDKFYYKLDFEIVLEELKAIQEKKQLDPEDLLKKYDLYFRKWKTPYN
jgi:hypothetical protein